MPDLRGLFLRGHGGNSSALGIQQGDAIRNIKGSFGVDAMILGASGAFSRITWHDGGHAGIAGTGGISFDASRAVPTAEENRPVNQAVRYLMRALP